MRKGGSIYLAERRGDDKICVAKSLKSMEQVLKDCKGFSGLAIIDDQPMWIDSAGELALLVGYSISTSIVL